MYSAFSERKYRDTSFRDGDIYSDAFKEEFFDKTVENWLKNDVQIRRFYMVILCKQLGGHRVRW